MARVDLVQDHGVSPEEQDSERVSERRGCGERFTKVANAERADRSDPEKQQAEAELRSCDTAQDAGHRIRHPQLRIDRGGARTILEPRAHAEHRVRPALRAVRGP